MEDTKMNMQPPEAHPLGPPSWKALPQMASAQDLLPLARRLLSGITLSVLFEDHLAYAPLHTAARLAGFAATQYELARAEIGVTLESDYEAVTRSSTALEYAVVSLDRAVDHLLAVRARLGGQPGFVLSRAEPGTRGEHPMQISKVEKRSLGNVKGLKNLRNAIEHADERLLRGMTGETMLVPRELGVSLDDVAVSYADVHQAMTQVCRLVGDILEAGGT